MKVVLASRNKGKKREFQAILKDSGIDLTDLDEFPQIGELEENEDSFLGNARSKAHTTARESGLPALADDSGLAVDALNGAPGVWSARYSGPGATDRKNFEKLMAEMRDVPDEKRGAAFVCCLVLAWPDGREISAQGRCRGIIAREPKGENGFGYDPVFFVEEYGQSMAQLPAEVKNSISHRSRAAVELTEILAREVID